MTSMQLIAPTARFGLNLMRTSVKANPGKNTIVSPLSVSPLLGLVAAGAVGDTYWDMMRALGLQYSDKETANLAYANLQAVLSKGDLGVQLKMANSLWMKQGVRFVDRFVDAGKRHYSAQVETRDFGAPATIPEMNQWVSDKTDGAIDKMVESLDPLSAAILLNAVKFEGAFVTQFEEHMTWEQRFRTPAGEKQHPLMNRTGTMRLVHNDDLVSVVLPYGETDNRVNQYVMLPNKRNGRTLDDVVASLSQETLYGFFRDRSTEEVRLTMPKFAADSDLTLNDTLKAMGMASAFDANVADFSDMVDASQGRVHISSVQHKCKIAVDEKGTKMEAATKAEMVFESCIQAGFEFTVDEPFVTLGVDEGSGAMLWAGVINDPQRIAE